MAISTEGTRFHFDDLTLDIGTYHLARGDDPIHLGKLTFEMLRILVEAAPNAVSHDDLICGTWGTRKVVSAETLSQRVLLLRRALGDEPTRPRYIEVIRGVGYRIIPQVRAETSAVDAFEDSATRRGRRYFSTASRYAVGAGVIASMLALGLLALLLNLRDVTDAEALAKKVTFEVLPSAEMPFGARPYSRDIAISHDGRQLAYSSSAGSIVVRALESLDSTRLENLGPEVHNVTFSPDGKTLAFLTGGSLHTVSIDGGTVEMLADVGQYTDGDLEWTGAGFLLVANPRGLLRVPSSGDRAVELLIAPDPERDERSFGSPTLLADNRTVLFVVDSNRAGEQRRIESFDLISGERKEVFVGGASPRYVSTGHLVVTVGDELRAMPFDTGELELRGEPVTLAENVLVNSNGTANYSISNDATLVYVPTTAAESGRKLVWVTRHGEEEEIPVPAMSFSYPRLSPDGRWIALDVRWQESDIWLWDVRRESLSRLTNNPEENALPAWHPDGRHLAFSDGRNGTLDVFLADVLDGTVRELIVGERREMPVTFSNDGKLLLYGEDQPDGRWSMRVLDMESGKHWPLVTSNHSILNPTFSPNSEWVAYASAESGQFEVYVRRFTGPEGQRWQVSQDGGSKPLWSRDGKEIFYVSLDSQLMSTEVMQGPTFELGAVNHLLDASQYFGPQLGTGARAYDLSLDGTRFLMARQTSTEQNAAAISRIVVVVNALK